MEPLPRPPGDIHNKQRRGSRRLGRCPRSPHCAGERRGDPGRALGITVPDHREDAPEVRIADAAQPTLETFQARGLEGTLDMGFAELPATMVANILNLEFLVHAWDFSVATGAQLEVSPVLSDYVLQLARKTISPQMRGNSFAEETLVDESAASLDRLVAFTGRWVAVH
ncbi:TIGR03086 family metal-binding protein [Paenarthrobacter sp. Z7-10]|uniref:TIGR03086 family metal-binding protein n=1 Tax=Paenarthrobacter sp. Z7-10 TaxID=2787635 RepID=UPI0022A9BB9F|nr:TIGR03086 family metal-binding protein [Paenarthrobacter sp. Z7-10]